MKSYPFKRIFITGGSGFIGSHFIEKIFNDYQDFEILNIDKMSYASSKKTNALFSSSSNFNFLELDISDKNLLSRSLTDFQPDLIINFAAESHVDNSIEHSEDFIKSNIIGTYNLLEEIRILNGSYKNLLFHHISTDEVYGDLDLTQESFSEENRYEPSSPYSSSKASSDLLVQAWGRTYGIPFLITNCSNNYGPRQHSEKFIPTIINNLLKGDKVPIYGDGRNIRDWLFVEDHIDAIFSLHSQGCFNDIFNIGGNDEKLNIDLVHLIIEKMSTLNNLSVDNNQIEFVRDRKGHDLRYSINSEKLRKSTGWEPSVSFDKGISKTIKWYIDNSDWWE